MCVLDVGANEGLFTLFFRKRVGPGGRVIALEPSERELTHLKRNLRINRFLDVEVVPLAVGDHVGRARLSLAEAGHAGHNALGTPAAPWVERGRFQVEVEVSTLDTLSDARNWPRIALIKMDIEGSELRALRGADRLLARDRPMLLPRRNRNRFHFAARVSQQLLSWLAARKYRAMDFSSTDGRPAPLDTGESSRIISPYAGGKAPLLAGKLRMTAAPKPQPVSRDQRRPRADDRISCAPRGRRPR